MLNSQVKFFGNHLQVLFYVTGFSTRVKPRDLEEHFNKEGKVYLRNIQANQELEYDVEL
jgi:hypothetical protein